MSEWWWRSGVVEVERHLLSFTLQELGLIANLDLSTHSFTLDRRAMNQPRHSRSSALGRVPPQSRAMFYI